MRENDGRKLDHQTLEAMRLRAVDAVESGVHPEDVAASLGMGRGIRHGWLAKYREGGRDALRARPGLSYSRTMPFAISVSMRPHQVPVPQRARGRTTARPAATDDRSPLPQWALGAYETPIDKMLSLLPRRVTLELVPDQGAEPRLDGL